MSDEQQKQQKEQKKQKEQMMCGGPSGVKDANEKIQELCDQVKSEAEEQANKKFDQFEAKKYRSQVVSGNNYFVKVHVGGENYVHLEIYQELPCYGGAVKLSKLHEGKTSTCSL